MVRAGPPDFKSGVLTTQTRCLRLRGRVSLNLKISTTVELLPTELRSFLGSVIDLKNSRPVLNQSAVTLKPKGAFGLF